MPAQFVVAARTLVILGLVTGCAYPALVTVLAQIMFPDAANGSLLVRDGRPVGSALIGQAFVSERYFRGRPSATGVTPYNGALSSGSNLGPLNPALLEAVGARLAALRTHSPDAGAPPVDLVTASASGLDPHVSLAAAYYQVPRVAAARGTAPAAVRTLVERLAEPRRFGWWGEPRVNVLRLNLALDDAQ